MTLTRHRLPADTVAAELKTLVSVVRTLPPGVGVVPPPGVETVPSVVEVEAGWVTVPPVDGGWVVGVFLTEKARDWAPHSFRVKTIVRFSPAGRGGVIIMVFGFKSKVLNGH